MSDSTDKILTLQEVSERTRVPVATLRYWRTRTPDRGPRLFTLGGHKGRLVAKASDVEAWIEAQRVGAQ
jgi:predicted DNA-binding transcriptional regulator AlpA